MIENDSEIFGAPCTVSELSNSLCGGAKHLLPSYCRLGNLHHYVTANSDENLNAKFFQSNNKSSKFISHRHV